MSNAIISTSNSFPVIGNQASSDAQLIAMWLHGKSAHSQRAYGADVERFTNFTGKALQQVTLSDLQAFVDSLAEMSPNSQKRIVSSVKSLLSFGHKLGYLAFNVGGAVKSPKVKNTLAERILTEDEVLAMIHQTPKQRDRVLLRLLYASAGRVSEVAGLCWRDVQPNGDSGQVTLFGKGEETRTVKLSAGTWKELQALRNGAAGDAPVFASQKGGNMTERQIRRIVEAAAKRAGIEGNVSPHWLRHSHASHALDRGASVALVRDTLGHSSVAITSRYLHAKPGDSSALHLAV